MSGAEVGDAPEHGQEGEVQEDYNQTAEGGEGGDNVSAADAGDEMLEKMKANLNKADQEIDAIALLQQLQNDGVPEETSKEWLTLDQKKDRDSRSVHVGQCDYSTEPDELHAHFSCCGSIKTVYIKCDPFTGKPLGYAYVEFESVVSVPLAVGLNGSTFKGRTITVSVKRTNLPGGAGRGRGRGGAQPQYYHAPPAYHGSPHRGHSPYHHPYSRPPRGSFRGRGAPRSRPYSPGAFRSKSATFQP